MRIFTIGIVLIVATIPPTFDLVEDYRSKDHLVRSAVPTQASVLEHFEIPKRDAEPSHWLRVNFETPDEGWVATNIPVSAEASKAAVAAGKTDISFPPSNPTLAFSTSAPPEPAANVKATLGLLTLGIAMALWGGLGVMTGSIVSLATCLSLGLLATGYGVHAWNVSRPMASEGVATTARVIVEKTNPNRLALGSLKVTTYDTPIEFALADGTPCTASVRLNETHLGRATHNPAFKLPIWYFPSDPTLVALTRPTPNFHWLTIGLCLLAIGTFFSYRKFRPIPPAPHPESQPGTAASRPPSPRTDAPVARH